MSPMASDSDAQLPSKRKGSNEQEGSVKRTRISKEATPSTPRRTTGSSPSLSSGPWTPSRLLSQINAAMAIAHLRSVESPHPAKSNHSRGDSGVGVSSVFTNTAMEVLLYLENVPGNSELDGYEDESATFYFRVLPDRRILPEWYEFFKDPASRISLAEITERLQDSTYDRRPRPFAAFMDDFETMIMNAHQFNDMESDVFADGMALQKAFDEMSEWHFGDLETARLMGGQELAEMLLKKDD